MPFKHLFCWNKKQWRTARTRHSFVTEWIWVFMSCPNWQTPSNNQQSIFETTLPLPTACRSRGRIITASICAEIFLKLRLLHFKLSYDCSFMTAIAQGFKIISFWNCRRGNSFSISSCARARSNSWSCAASSLQNKSISKVHCSINGPGVFVSPVFCFFWHKWVRRCCWNRR